MLATKMFTIALPFQLHYSFINIFHHFRNFTRIVTFITHFLCTFPIPILHCCHDFFFFIQVMNNWDVDPEVILFHIESEWNRSNLHFLYHCPVVLVYDCQSCWCKATALPSVHTEFTTCTFNIQCLIWISQYKAISSQLYTCSSLY